MSAGAALLAGLWLSAAPPPSGNAGDDPALAALVQEALEARPELAQGQAELLMAHERVPQVQAFPDPMLQVGVQNDGFTEWNVGKMGTSYISFMASQTFPFPGKQALKGEVAEQDVRRRQFSLERLRLSTEAEVRRAYLSLQLARERLLLLQKLETLWEKSVGTAQSRYEAGDGAQSDVLRAQLERARLQQRRRVLEGEARREEQSLNRLRRKPLGEPVATPRRLDQVAFPTPPDESAAIASALERSPEVQGAGTAVVRAERARALAGKAALPDLAVGVGLMVRGPLEPMWQVTVGVPVPIFTASRQGHGMAEADAAKLAAGHEVEAAEQLLALRTHQRLDAWRTLKEIWEAYQHGLLVQAEATAESTLAQYRVGKVSFASVVEANAAAIAEAEAAQQVLADGLKLAIAHDELSLAEGAAASAPMPTSEGSSGAAASGM